jgi:hypothetical protein
MTNQHPQNVSRRNFLKAATITAAAAVATGGGAAVLKRFEKDPVISTGAIPPAAPTLPPFATAAPILSDIIPTVPAAVAAPGDDLMAQLAASQTEVMQLRAANDQLQRDLAALQTAEQEGRTARDSLTLELDGARNQLGILGGLVALYQQLDDADVGGLLENGLNAVGEKIGELVGGTPALASGLDSGALALGEVEAHIPLLDNGRAWLDAQGAKINGIYGEIEVWLQRAVERVGDFLELLAEWFAGIRRWLPFGMGEKAVGVMGALTALLAETPTTVAGMSVNVAQPLDVWLARIDGEPELTRRLVRPLRDEVIGRARVTVDQANQVSAVYDSQLATPARAALSNRQALRQAIADYRAQNQI